MRIAWLICVVVGGTASATVSAADLTPDDVRAQYLAARPKLEAIWASPAHYVFKYTSERTGIPTDKVGKVQATSTIQYEVFGRKGSWRLDTIAAQPDGSKKETVVVSTADDQFSVTKRSGEEFYTPIETAGLSGYFENSEKTILVLCGSAFILPTRFDVKEILSSPNYRITVVPTAGTGSTPTGVTCAFERTPKSDPAQPIRQLLFEEGRITFLPDKDWAIAGFQLRANTGLNMEGRVQYQAMDDMKSPAVPKRTELSMTDARSPIKTNEVLEAISITPGPVDDRVFSPSRFPVKKPVIQTKDLARKQSEGWNPTPLLIGLGVSLIVVAIAVRVVTQRKGRS